MEIQREKYKEKIKNTLIRNFLIALLIGLIFTFVQFDNFNDVTTKQLTINIISIFWISFGGHWIDILYLNYLRFQLPKKRHIETTTRLLWWYLGGTLLFTAVSITQNAFNSVTMIPLISWYYGIIFILIEFVAHGIMQLVRKESFWNGKY